MISTNPENRGRIKFWSFTKDEIFNIFFYMYFHSILAANVMNSHETYWPEESEKSRRKLLSEGGREWSNTVEGVVLPLELFKWEKQKIERKHDTNMNM